MEKNIVIKCCPFCGNTDLDIYSDVSYNSCDPDYYVDCNECGLEGPWAKTKEEAIKLWNDMKVDKSQ